MPQSLYLLAATIASATAQSVAGAIGAFSSYQLLCNKTFNDANATGIYSFNPGVQQGPQGNNTSGYTSNATWAVTVAQGNPSLTNSTTQLGLWYNTGGANYSDDFALGYDACIVAVSGLSTNTLYRAQSDNGSCLATFNSDCVNALQSTSQDYATQLVSDPTPLPNSNLTVGTLYTVCDSIGRYLTANFPKQCMPYTNASSILVAGTAMTSESTEAPVIPPGCNINGTFQQATTVLQPATEFWYDALNAVVYPLLTVFLPIADIKRVSTISQAKTTVQCVHTDHFNPGSRVSPALPSGTPVDLSPGGLSGGAIAGIVVGAVVGVALIAGAAWWFRRKRRNAKKVVASTDGQAYNADHKSTPPAYEAPQDAGMTELGPDSIVRPELPTQNSGPRAELGGDEKPLTTMRTLNHGQPAELQGATPRY